MSNQLENLKIILDEALSGKLNLVLACRKIARIRYTFGNSDIESDENIWAIIGIESQTDELSIDESTQKFSTAADAEDGAFWGPRIIRLLSDIRETYFK